MFPKFGKLLWELHQFWLKNWEYAISGSWPMAIRDIRDVEDLDIIVKVEIFNILSNKFPDNIVDGYKIFVWDYEITDRFMWDIEVVKKMIENADIIEWFPYISLDYVFEYKRKLWREKDLRDIELLEKYLWNQ